MTVLHLGGVVILTAGIAILIATLPVLHLIPRRNGTVTTQLGTSMVAWLTRVFGIITVILGLVTLLQR